jgi:hypothetical protein
MSQQNLSTVLIKLLGIYLAAESINLFQSIAPYLAQANTSNPQESISYLWILPSISSLILSLCLIFFGESLSKVLFKQDQKITSELDLKPIHMMAISVVGLILFIDSIPLICSSIIYYIKYDMENQVINIYSILNYWLPNVIIPTLKIFLGLFLFFGSNVISNFWFKIRSPMNA